MDKDLIREAGERARVLASRVADLMVNSDVPLAHWEEILERVSDIMERHVKQNGTHAEAEVVRVQSGAHTLAAELEEMSK